MVFELAVSEGIHAPLSQSVLIFQKIVVATDFSEFAAVALLRAANLALRFQASIVLAHVIDPISLAAGSDGMPFVVQDDERTVLQKLEAAAAHPLLEGGILFRSARGISATKSRSSYRRSGLTCWC
jgi:nucleotide-binding universal stress UspA family protein